MHVICIPLSDPDTAINVTTDVTTLPNLSTGKKLTS